MSVPSGLKYTAEHEWLHIDGDTATVGITAFAADALGDVVYLELPSVGTSVIAGAACGEIESTKSVSDIHAPADGEILEINDAAAEDPSVVNLDPYAAGWLFRMRLPAQPELLSQDAYERLIHGM